jgi:gliding motility-associated-like protein
MMINDIFLPQFDCDISNYQMRLFDRWGELIFETDDPYYGWNGKRTNLPVKIGVYVFEVFYDAQLEVNGSAVHFEKTGTVQVLR